jgi:8-oxo-dGTP diphosphatase
MIDVACAIIMREDGKVLVTQRSESMKLPLKMEFPGGKVEPGELPKACLIREIQEELAVQIEIIAELPSNKHDYPDFRINLIPFVCCIIAGTITLNEHVAYAWMGAEELGDLDWAAADIPVVRAYLSFLNSSK